jgi:hypothetical protein
MQVLADLRRHPEIFEQRRRVAPGQLESGNRMALAPMTVWPEQQGRGIGGIEYGPDFLADAALLHGDGDTRLTLDATDAQDNRDRIAGGCVVRDLDRHLEESGRHAGSAPCIRNRSVAPADPD